MRKLFFCFIFFSLTLLLIFLNTSVVLAQTGKITTDPQTVKADFNDTITIACANKESCFPINTALRVIAYPTNGTLGDFIKPSINLSPVTSGILKSTDGKTINVPLDFNTTTSWGTVFLKPSFIGPWNILVCYNKSLYCQKSDEDLIAQEQIYVVPLAPTPTPTPASDQPIIDYSQQDACTFQHTTDPEFSIPIKVQNLKLDTEYEWWWNEGIFSPEQKDHFTANNLATTTAEINGIPTTLWNVIIWGDKLKPENLTNPRQNTGHVFCIDIAGKEAITGKEKYRRTGANCIRLFFISGVPTPGQKACFSSNSGATTPTPTPLLPQCGSWSYLNGTPVPTGSDGTQEQFIHENNLLNSNVNSNGINCATIDTAIGNISTNPQEFVKYIFSVVLGLAGGIALILIIVSGYKMMASQGNPEALNAARDHLLSTIIGLLFIIFAFVILQIIGVDILKIPGFQP